MSTVLWLPFQDHYSRAVLVDFGDPALHAVREGAGVQARSVERGDGSRQIADVKIIAMGEPRVGDQDLDRVPVVNVPRLSFQAGLHRHSLDHFTHDLSHYAVV